MSPLRIGLECHGRTICHGCSQSRGQSRDDLLAQHWRLEANCCWTVSYAQIWQWHHYASTYDGNEAKLYFDGKPAGVQKLTGPLSRSDVVLHISNSC